MWGVTLHGVIWPIILPDAKFVPNTPRHYQNDFVAAILPYECPLPAVFLVSENEDANIF